LSASRRTSWQLRSLGVIGYLETHEFGFVQLSLL
jgi:hypothetical protein